VNKDASIPIALKGRNIKTRGHAPVVFGRKCSLCAVGTICW
jgi:hypothetical protein